MSTSVVNATEIVSSDAGTNATTIGPTPDIQEEALQKQGLAVDFSQNSDQLGSVDVSHAVGRPEVGKDLTDHIVGSSGSMSDGRASLYLPLCAFFFCLCFAMTILAWRRKRVYGTWSLWPFPGVGFRSQHHLIPVYDRWGAGGGGGERISRPDIVSRQSGGWHYDPLVDDTALLVASQYDPAYSSTNHLSSVANQRWEERLADDLDDGVYRPSTYSLRQAPTDREPRLEFSPSNSPAKA